MARSHSICVPHTRGVYEVGVGMSTYVVSFPRVLHEAKFPVPGCPSVAHSSGRLREHFMYCHFRSNVAVVQEGTETLPRCDFCGMHMASGQLISHSKTACCNKNTQIRKRKWYVAIASRCLEATFSLTGEEEAERIGGVEVFKYLRQLLYRSYKDWPVVLCNNRKVMQLWSRLGKLLWREGAEPEFL